MFDRFETQVIAHLDDIEVALGAILSALTDLQAADDALKAEVATFLTDISGRLTSGSVDDTAAEAIAADINAEVEALKAADPATATPPPPPAP